MPRGGEFDSGSHENVKFPSLCPPPPPWGLTLIGALRLQNRGKELIFIRKEGCLSEFVHFVALILHKASHSQQTLFFLIFWKRLDEEDRPTGCLLCPMRNDIEINYKVSYKYQSCKMHV